MTRDEKLIYMANQIARNFAYLGESDAAAATADHLRNFWDPAMRRTILAQLAAGGEGLGPTAKAAVLALEAAA
ncbi:MAG TPA: formate dehydrogenase subunit delta [Caulobacteraceae bacterium]|jgi:formate dehydrogenase subunit delta